MAWWHRESPPVFAQDAQWAQLRRAIDRGSPAYWSQVRQECTARAARLLAASNKLIDDSRRCLRTTR